MGEDPVNVRVQGQPDMAAPDLDHVHVASQARSPVHDTIRTRVDRGGGHPGRRRQVTQESHLHRGGAPSVITCSTSSGLRWDRTLASTPPRLWPTSETRAPVRCCSCCRASSSGRSMTSEYMTLNATPAIRGL